MPELTPLAEEVDSLRSWVVEACQHANEAKRAFEALSSRLQRDDKEANKVRKEQNKMLQKDVETHQRILDLLAKVEKEKKLKLGSKEKLMALEKRVSLDAMVVAQLHKEQDELLQTAERLHLECGMAHEEHDQAL